jgi:hypothetical protein
LIYFSDSSYALNYLHARHYSGMELKLLLKFYNGLG